MSPQSPFSISSPRRSQCPTHANREQALKVYKQRERYQNGSRPNSEPSLRSEARLQREARQESRLPRQHSEAIVRPRKTAKPSSTLVQPPRPQQEAPATLDVARMFNKAMRQAEGRPGSALKASDDFAVSRADTQRVVSHTEKAIRSMAVLGHLVEDLKQATPATACTRTTALGKTRIDYALFRKLSAEDQLATALEYVIQASRPQAGDAVRPNASSILNGAGSASLGAMLTQLVTRPFMPAANMKGARDKIRNADDLDAESRHKAQTFLAAAAREGQKTMAGTAANMKALVQMATDVERVLRNVAQHNTDPARTRSKNSKAAAEAKQAATDAVRLASTLRLALTDLSESISADDWAFQRQAREYAAALP